ncbi:MAG: class I SAM-dependent methyltransferase, partial [Stellaceae bacterium]
MSEIAVEADEPASRPQIALLPGFHRRAEGSHPWVYSNEIVMDGAAKALQPGTLVTLRRADERPFGVAIFNPHTLIAGRLLDRDAARAIDKRFFARRLERALRLRERLYDMPYYRLVHAEADGLPGLVIDRFGGVLAMQANTAGMDRLTPLITEALRELISPAAIVLRNDSSARGQEGLPLETAVALGTIEGPVKIEEGGAVFLADVLAGQKTGWFFDQRDNRAFIAGLAGGTRVLDLYCHSGGFAVAAAHRGAAAVVGIDSSAPALALAAQAARENGV